jgi:hypothetical protein
MQPNTVISMIYSRPFHGPSSNITVYSIEINHFSDRDTSYKYILGSLIYSGGISRNYDIYDLAFSHEFKKNNTFHSNLDGGNMPESLKNIVFENKYRSVDENGKHNDLFIPYIAFRILEGTHTSIPDLRDIFDI